MSHPPLQMQSHTTAIPMLQIFATGGTIAGVASDAHNAVHYQAAALPVTQLLQAVPALQQLAAEVRAEQLFAKDSKDLDPADWLCLARAVDQALQEPRMAGIVITHGTDTLEETAWWLHRTLRPSPKPVVLVSAMRPANALGADGPQNLWDACCVALSELTGVVCVAAGEVHRAETVQKQQPYRIPAFGSGSSGPLAWVEEGRVVPAAPAPAVNKLQCPADDAIQTQAATDLMARGKYHGLLGMPVDAPVPAIAWITSHAGFDARQVQALQAAGFDGVLVAGTGNASLHHALEAALEEAIQAGLAIALTSRCTQGTLVAPASQQLRHRLLPLPAAKARLELLMELWHRNTTQ